MGLITSLTLQAQNQPCITSLSVSVGSCSTLTNNYSLTGVFTANDVNTPPLTVTVTTGTSTVIQSLTANNNTFAFTFNGLPSDGQQKIITVATSSTACSTISQSYTAPVSCTTALPCSLSLALTPGICSSATNAYSLSGTLSANNVTPPINITISGSGFTPLVQSLTAINNTVNFTVNGLSSDGILKTITVNTSASACSVFSQTYTAPVSCTQSTSPGPCPQIDLTTINNSQICNGQCSSFSVITSTTAVIQLVRFTSPQTGTAVYSGSTVMDEGTPTNGVLVLPQGIPGLSFPQNTGTSPITYYVYALLKDQPTAPACRPFAATQVAVLPSPQFSLTSLQPCLISLNRPVLVNVSSAGTYEVTFSQSISAVSCGLSAPVSPIATQTITGGTTATLTIPKSVSGIMLVTNMVTGCQSISSVAVLPFQDPTFSIMISHVNCTVTSPNNDGKLTIIETPNAIAYQYSQGNVFDPLNATPSTPQPIPGDGVIANNLGNPITPSGQPYTIRFYGVGGCFIDQIVELPYWNCACMDSQCIPITAQRIR